MPAKYRQSDLEAYLDEALPVEEMAQIEQALRGDRELRSRLAVLQGRRNAGVHSLGEIWRNHRLSCPSRQQLGSLLLDVLPQDLGRYLTFHLEVVGCRYCQANLADLKEQQAAGAQAESRRRKYFQSSAGYLRSSAKEHNP